MSNKIEITESEFEEKRQVRQLLRLSIAGIFKELDEPRHVFVVVVEAVNDARVSGLPDPPYPEQIVKVALDVVPL